MASGEVEAVRGPLRIRDRTARALDERIALRFPAFVAAWARAMAARPPSSRLRHALVWRSWRMAIEAYNRRDLDAVMIGSHEDVEYLPAQPLVEAGLMEPRYEGREGYRAYTAAAAEVWGGETRLEPEELIDLGDRMVVLAKAPMRAQASGVPLTLTFALVVTMRDGRATRFQEYHDHGEALAAVGLGAGAR
jgi:ketosteroid isomerase-like protein